MAKRMPVYLIDEYKTTAQWHKDPTIRCTNDIIEGRDPLTGEPKTRRLHSVLRPGMRWVHVAKGRARVCVLCVVYVCVLVL